MSVWETEPINYHGNDTVVALRLADGTRLENYHTVLENKYGQRETFEVIRDKEFVWYGWGPHKLQVTLTASTIESLYNAGELTVVNSPDNE